MEEAQQEQVVDTARMGMAAEEQVVVTAGSPLPLMNKPPAKRETAPAMMPEHKHPAAANRKVDKTVTATGTLTPRPIPPAKSTSRGRLSQFCDSVVTTVMVPASELIRAKSACTLPTKLQRRK